MLGSDFVLPEPAPAGYVVVGDVASLPAINSLLAAIGDSPVRVFLEYAHHDDRELAITNDTPVTWVVRKNAGEALVEAVRSAAFDAPEHFGWVACDSRTTREVVKVLRDIYNVPRKSIKARGYWEA